MAVSENTNTRESERPECEDRNYAECQGLGDDLRQGFVDLLYFADGGEEEPGSAFVAER